MRNKELGIRDWGLGIKGLGIRQWQNSNTNVCVGKLIFVLLLITYHLLLITPAQAQSSAKYLVTLKDKNNSPYSVVKPLEFLSQRSVSRRIKQNIPVVIRDLPVNPTYINEIKKTGAKVWYSSRWMNAVMVECSNTVLQNILKLSFVKGLEVKGTIDNPRTRSGRKAAKFEALATESLDYGLAKTQVNMIGADRLHNQNFTGKGMLIGVFDSGFYNVNSIAGFKPLFDTKRIVGTYDFVKKESSVYEDDGHGTEVLSCMAANVPGKMIGTAPDASFLLLRTEDDGSEYIIEEVNWLLGAEYADSVGVDLINSSLGYTTFDDISTDHTYAQMNGNTTIAARAADWAAAVGIVCVVSAGNDGQSNWKYISTPADADSIIAVGSVNANRVYALSSSQGNPADKRIKPDLVAQGQSAIVLDPSDGSLTTSSGTSFSSPILCGMVACYWQANPTLTAMQVMDNLRKSGSQYSNPDRVLGYGIPNFFRENTMSFTLFPNPSNQEITIEINDFLAPDFQATLTDIYGKVHWSKPILNTIQTFSVETLASGMYFLRVGNGGRSSIVRFIKK
ncbi:MAG: S8 family peptidase [Arcicella sp.]|nr:S8 family peptidase [Arcicella sp.]